MVALTHSHANAKPKALTRREHCRRRTSMTPQAPNDEADMAVEVDVPRLLLEVISSIQMYTIYNMI